MEAHKFTTVDEYINSFPLEVRKILEKLRQTIARAAPNAEEVISYNMPAFKLNGALVYYAAYKKHVGFYPTNSGITEFADELADYKTSKGAIQFPLEKPLPTGLITKIVKFRAVENKAKALAKKNK